MAAAKATAVLQGVNRDLRRWEQQLPGVGSTALAESARALARELGDGDNSATSKALCARALMETLERIESSLPPARQSDRIDELGAAREQRRGASAA